MGFKRDEVFPPIPQPFLSMAKISKPTQVRHLNSTNLNPKKVTAKIVQSNDKDSWMNLAGMMSKEIGIKEVCVCVITYELWLRRKFVQLLRC